MTADDRLIVKWNLPRLAADLAAHLAAIGSLEGDDVLDSEAFLEPYHLSPDKEHTVTLLAWNAQCRDCGMYGTTTWSSTRYGRRPD